MVSNTPNPQEFGHKYSIKKNEGIKKNDGIKKNESSER